MFTIAREPYLDLRDWRKLATNIFLHSNDGWFHEFNIIPTLYYLSEENSTFRAHKVVLGNNNPNQLKLQL